jgi:[ribosomal protein S18]-alanine N-acetyltransferase
MTIADVPQVAYIDSISFAAPWSAQAYEFEINESKSSKMVVLVQTSPGQQDLVVAYGGMWLIAGEGHISTVATHPSWRGKGYGEAVVVGLLGLAIATHADYVVLEARVSNTVAIALYEKYGFRHVGIRKQYYREENEDATLMHLAPLDEAYTVKFLGMRKALEARFAFNNLVSEALE